MSTPETEPCLLANMDLCSWNQIKCPIKHCTAMLNNWDSPNISFVCVSIDQIEIPLGSLDLLMLFNVGRGQEFPMNFVINVLQELRKNDLKHPCSDPSLGKFNKNTN